MINFIIGSGGSGKSTVVSDMIRREIENGSRDVVLIVPEQQAVAWETRMSTVLPPSANLRLEITNFTRLPNSVFREHGGLSDTVVDEGTRALIVWRAMLAVREQMQVYTSGENGHDDRAIPFLMSAVDELKQSGITPGAAEAALDELKRMSEADGGEGGYSSLIPRLSDAVNVYAAYNAVLHEEFIDRGDLLDNLYSTLREHPYFKGKCVFVDSFFSLTAAEERILGLIMRQADDVTVTFPLPVSAERRGDVQFGEIADFEKRTAALAARAGLEVNRIMLTQNHRHADGGELCEIERGLFDGAREDDGSAGGEPTVPSESVKIIKCTDVYDEAEACAAIILKLIREGYKYSDIAVVARDISGREGVIDTVLRRHGIKCFMSASSEVSSSPAVKLVLAALSVAVGGWQRRDIVRLIKTGLMPHMDISDSTLGELENNFFESYTYTWNIRGRRMYCADKWTMNPDGYTERMTEAGKEMLRRVNACKDRLIPPLDRLLSVFGDGRGVAPVRDIAERIVYFAEECGVAERLSELSESYRAIGMERDGARVSASWDAVCEILDKMVAVIGDAPLDAVRFSRLFAAVASNMDRGTIPTGADEVVLGSAAGVRFDSVRCVIMLGALEDEFPRGADDGSGFFDDRDKVMLESAGMTLAAPKSDIMLSREYFMFYRTATAATDKLYVLAPTGGGDALSTGAEDIERILSSLGKNGTYSFGAMPLDEIVYDEKTAEYLLSRRTDEAEIKELERICTKGGAKMPLTARADTVSPASGVGESVYLSQSAMKTFVGCRFKYYCDNKVRLRAEKRAKLDIADVGTFVHRIFERFFTEVSAEKIASGELGRDEMTAVSERIIEEYISCLAESGGRRRGDLDGRLKYLFGRLSRHVLVFIEAMVNEISQSKFIPAAFELGVGTGEDGNRIDALDIRTDDGCSVKLRGIADRVDVYDAPDGKRYVRIVDYKTGTKTFSLADVSRGLEVQLLLYLFSVWKFGLGASYRESADRREIVPAGAVYFGTKAAALHAKSIADAETNRQNAVESVERSGVLLRDEDVLRAMDSGLEGRFIPVGEVNGAIVPKKKSTVLLSAKEFGELYTELETTVKRIADEIRSGCAEAQAGDTCKYCEYNFVCKARGGCKA